MITFACLEVYTQLDIKPVVLLFFSPVVTFIFSAQILHKWPCVCLIDMLSAPSSGASLSCDLDILWSVSVSFKECKLIMVLITFYLLLCQRCSLYGAGFVRMMNGSFNCF